MKVVKKEELASYIGKEIAPTEWFTITQEQINQFADCTHDHQFIHVDEELAKKTPFGGTIAHGLLSLSMLPYFAEQFALMVEGTVMGVNYGFDKVRFITPVKVNSRIRALATIRNAEEKSPGRFVFKMDITIEIEGESKPALIAEWIAMQFVH